MERGLTGHYVDSIAGGVRCQAFLPDPLPPAPPLALDGTLQRRINHAMLALGRLDAISTLLPDASLFLYSYVRKEAVMSSLQIEGTQASISDLMLYEMEACRACLWTTPRRSPAFDHSWWISTILGFLILNP